MTNFKNFTTAEGRVSYPSVFTPSLNKLSGKTSYEVTLLFPKNSPYIQELKALVVAAAKEKFGDTIPAKFKNPLKDGDTAVEADGVTPKKGYAGMIYAKFSVDSTKAKPVIVDENVQPILEQSKFYGGCFARVNASAFGYDHLVNKGVSFGLNSIQKIRDGEPFGTLTPDVNDVFGPIANHAGSENPANYAKPAAAVKAAPASFNDLLA